MNDIFRIDGKVAVIAGGAGGIGSALAQGLARYGARLAIADIDISKAKQVAQDIQSEYSSEAVAFQFDIRDEKSVSQLAESVQSRFKTADILVNAHGINIKSPADKFPASEWDDLFNVNVKGIMLTCREFGKMMIAQKRGKIISISSIRGTRATIWDGNEGYCATKGAVDMMTRALASEWAKYNINVNAIAPGRVATPMTEKVTRQRTDSENNIYNIMITNTPQKRIGLPEELVGACVFLVSPASDYVTGQIIYVDGGLSAVV